MLIKIFLYLILNVPEFIGSKKFFRQQTIVFKTNFGRNKANFAEWGIFVIKKRLYMLLRGILNQNWVQWVSKVVKDYNHTPLTKLGGIAPESINSEIDSVQVQEAQQKARLTVYKEPSYKIQRENQIKYEKDPKKLQIGDYVYLSTNEELFSKSYDVKVC